jgi:hypothetical protein
VKLHQQMSHRFDQARLQQPLEQRGRVAGEMNRHVVVAGVQAEAQCADGFVAAKARLDALQKELHGLED